MRIRGISASESLFGPPFLTPPLFSLSHARSRALPSSFPLFTNAKAIDAGGVVLTYTDGDGADQALRVAPCSLTEPGADRRGQDDAGICTAAAAAAAAAAAS